MALSSVRVLESLVTRIRMILCPAQSSNHMLTTRLLVGIGALAYFVGALLQIFIREATPYWRFLFPSLVITVLGADFQFIVANVRDSAPFHLRVHQYHINNIQLYVTKQMPSQASLAAGR